MKKFILPIAFFIALLFSTAYSVSAHPAGTHQECNVIDSYIRAVEITCVDSFNCWLSANNNATLDSESLKQKLEVGESLFIFTIPHNNGIARNNVSIGHLVWVTAGRNTHVMRLTIHNNSTLPVGIHGSIQLFGDTMHPIPLVRRALFAAIPAWGTHVESPMFTNGAQVWTGGIMQVTFDNQSLTLIF
ncbi:MAG: hypothetical protein FWC16_08565 [Defluviitaleaceae bacterium]|nr:hypothetical protein [Defluviitaleaceae bacterium]MCL2274963.1 hypothetical protein [Defluviitaleaceae bacterium]